MTTEKPLTLVDYTRRSLIIPQLTSCTTTSVMQELTDALQHQDGSVAPQLSSSVAALNRELLTGTALDLGAAFPHVRVAALLRPHFALGRSKKLLPWRAIGFTPTQLVFLIFIPSNAGAESAQLLSTLQQLGRNRSRLDELRWAAAAEEMFTVLAQIPLVAVNEAPRTHDHSEDRADSM